MAPVPAFVAEAHSTAQITKEFVEARLQSVSRHKFQPSLSEDLLLFGGADETAHGNVLYLNSSDSFNNLSMIPNLENARVLTIAGSGDFPLAFLEKGVAKLDVADISLPACLHTELKILAAKTFNFADFSKMFSTYAADFKSLNLSTGEKILIPIFDTEKYQELRTKLSLAARTYFDAAITDEFTPLSHLGIIKRGKSYHFFDLAYQVVRPPEHGLLRIRGPLEPSNAGAKDILSPFVLNEARYAVMQENLQRAEVNIYHASLSPDYLPFHEYDFIYSTNAGYDFAPRFAYSLLESGAKRVGFTLSVEGLAFYDSGQFASQKEFKERLAAVFQGVEVSNVFVDRRRHYGLYVEFVRS